MADIRFLLFGIIFESLHAIRAIRSWEPSRQGLAGLVVPILLICQLAAPARTLADSQGVPSPGSATVGGLKERAAPNGPDLARKNILVLHSFESTVPVFLGTDKGLLDTLRSGGVSTQNQFFESLDLRRNPGPEYRRLLVEQMRMKYSHRKPDIIITMYPEALEFVLNDCGDVLAHVPILALYLPQSFEVRETDRRIIEHFPALDTVGTLEIALKLVPRAKRVYVVSGAHEVDKRVENEVRRISRKWEGLLEFLYLSHMPLEDMLATVSEAPPDSIILALVLSQDVRGKIQTSQLVAQQLSRVSKAPIFGILEASLGDGIIGGSLFSFEHIGSKAGQLALDILGGTKTPDNIPAVLDVPAVPMFDWRQLRRWNLNEDALPKGSIVINKELTLWDLRHYIVAAVAFCLAQAALIIFLIVQGRRKKVVEQGLRQKNEELDQFFDVGFELFCIANIDGYFLRLNPAWERTLGHSREELMTKQFFDFVHPDDLGRTREAVAALASRQELSSFENRYRAMDGRYRWLQWAAAPAGKLIYAAARDVTENKEATETLRESEVKYRGLYEGLMDAFVRVDMTGQILEFNSAYQRMTGYEGEELRRMTYQDLTPEKWHDYEAAIIEEEVLPRGYSDVYEKEYLKKDGTVVPLELRAYLIRDRSGAPEGMWAIVRDITERKRGEEALRQRNQYIETVLEQAPIGFAIHTIDDGVGRFVSARFEEIYGVARGTIDSHHTFFEKVWPSHPDLREEISRRVSADMASGDPRRMYWENVPVPLRSGETRYITAMNIPVPDENLMVSTVQDVTERVRAENALRESELRFRQVAESVSDFIWEVDTNGLYTYTSPSVEKILGYLPDELIGKAHFYDLYAPEVREKLKEAAFNVFAAKEQFRAFPNPNIAKDGRLVHLETSGTPILDATGMLVGYRGADTDVTERSEMENRIRTAAEEWQSTFDSISDLVVVLDRDCRVMRVNAAARSFFGLPAERILGSRCHVLMHGTERPVEGCPFVRTMQSRRHEEAEHYDEARRAWFRMSTDPIFGEEGKIIEVVHSTKDITEQKRSETETFAARRELQRSERLLRMGELTASLAHELNQPLTSILSNTSAALRFIQSGKIDMEELTEILQDIANDDKRAGSIIRSLRSMLRPEEGERELTAINDLLHEVVTLFHSEAVIRRIYVDASFADSLPTVNVNRVQLQQVVINLMMNAAEWMQGESQNRRIVLRTQRTDDGNVLVTVRDSGPGIEETELARIFEPFFTTKRSGLGMGLSLSRSIIEGQGGHIWAVNNPDRGATFSFDLPAAGARGLASGAKRVTDDGGVD